MRKNACVHRLDPGIYSHSSFHFGDWTQNSCSPQVNNPLCRRLTGGSNPRRCTAQYREPKTLPTEPPLPPPPPAPPNFPQGGRLAIRPTRRHERTRGGGGWRERGGREERQVDWRFRGGGGGGGGGEINKWPLEQGSFTAFGVFRFTSKWRVHSYGDMLASKETATKQWRYSRIFQDMSLQLEICTIFWFNDSMSQM